MVAGLILALLAQDAPPNTWVPLKPVLVQPADPEEKGWMPLCYDSTLDRLVGMVRETIHTFRYDPER